MPRPRAGEAAADAWSPVCPDAPPALGGACVVNANPIGGYGPTCEYGDAWWSPACNTVVSCDKGTWQPSGLPGTTCGPKPGPNDPSCPSSSDNLAHMACPPTGVRCYYGLGAHCDCAPAGGDAGYWWDCLPDPGCPSDRPRVGAACTGNLGCAYENCSYIEQCLNGFWQVFTGGC